MLEDRIQERSTDFAPEVFLRSINIRYDAAYPERIAHFEPTTKTTALLKALAGEEAERAYLIVAPYGSGKSLTATYLLHLIENQPESHRTLEPIQQKLLRIAPTLDSFLRERQHSRGLVLALHGHCPHLGISLRAALAEAAERLELEPLSRLLHSRPVSDMDQAIQLLSEVRGHLHTIGYDRVLILWDEFGRHLETLLAEGRPEALLDIQVLAEFVSRSQVVPMVLGLLLHQDLLQYATHMPQSVRAEWRKIEGRFQTVQFIDESKEIYRLIAEVVSAQAVTDECPVDPPVRECLDFGLFADLSEQELDHLLRRAYPLEPTTLYLLPRISARVAQNERTLFTFLYMTDLNQPVSPAVLYDYFAQSMRMDSSAGGTFRQWRETESALGEVTSEPEAIKALKTACLLGIGASGERAQADYDFLLFALRGYAAEQDPEPVAQSLIKRGLLLFRPHSRRVSVWHGTDADLSGKLVEVKQRRQSEFDLIASLEQEFPAPVWRPVEYNAEYSVRRYFAGEYHSLDTIQEYLVAENFQETIPIGCDGKILYLAVQSPDQLEQAFSIAREQILDERLIVAVPRSPVTLFDAALELQCLIEMQHDRELISSDPFIPSEIQQMIEDSRSYLYKLCLRLTQPGEQGPHWFHRGRPLQVPHARALRSELSRIMRSLYSKTPVIKNELIVRNKPSAVIVNARRKLMMGILERSGQENLGIEGNAPDASMLRTVLLHTGLYRQDGEGLWRYATPEELSDRSLGEVWRLLQDLLTVPLPEPKDLKAFFDKLREPPYGIRDGVLPVLFAAALRAFPSALSLTKAGSYVTDILPTEVERICQEPELYEFRVLDLTPIRKAYLRGFYECFAGESPDEIREPDLIRACFDALALWASDLSPAALSTRRISERAQQLQQALLRPIEPARLLFVTIPTVCQCPVDDSHALLKQVRSCKAELENVVEIYRDQASRIVKRVLALGGSPQAEADAHEVAFQWSSCFPQSLISQLTDAVTKGIITRMQMRYSSDALLIDSLGSLLLGKPTTRWDDSDLIAFAKGLEDGVHRVEQVALSIGASSIESGAVVSGLTKLVEGRLHQLYTRLVELVGVDEARRAMHALAESRIERSTHDDD